MSDVPSFHPAQADTDRARLAAGGHVVTCSACRYDWVCACLPGAAEPSSCISRSGMCDDCAWSFIETCQDEDGELLAGAHTLTVQTLEGPMAVTYEAGLEISREPIPA